MESDEKAWCRKQDAQIFQVPAVQTEGACTEGKRKDLYYLSEVQDRVCEEELDFKEKD